MRLGAQPRTMSWRPVKVPDGMRMCSRIKYVRRQPAGKKTRCEGVGHRIQLCRECKIENRPTLHVHAELVDFRMGGPGPIMHCSRAGTFDDGGSQRLSPSRKAESRQNDAGERRNLKVGDR